ncbi:MAG: hypothetical protein L6R36_005055 [Xanthoria steineri]|nr:MAG: hypothetical protein L6R36_005055 [Xanthoria steineri]
MFGASRRSIAKQSQSQSSAITSDAQVPGLLQEQVMVRSKLSQVDAGASPAFGYLTALLEHPGAKNTPLKPAENHLHQSATAVSISRSPG